MKLFDIVVNDDGLTDRIAEITVRWGQKERDDLNDIIYAKRRKGQEYGREGSNEEFFQSHFASIFPQHPHPKETQSKGHTMPEIWDSHAVCDIEKSDDSTRQKSDDGKGNGFRGRWGNETPHEDDDKWDHDDDSAKENNGKIKKRGDEAMGRRSVMKPAHPFDFCRCFER